MSISCLVIPRHEGNGTMTTTPTITIYVRRSAGCKYEGDDFAKRCHCRKWLRWTQHGTRQRRMADTRLWAEAELVKREIEDQLADRVVETDKTGWDIRSAVDVLIAAKEVECVWQYGLAHFGGLFWPTPGTLWLRG